MKKVFLFILLISAFYYAKAEENPIKVNSEIKKVTLFQRGAQIQRTAYFRAGSGAQKIIIEDLPYNVLANSLQVKGKGNFSILSINFSKNYLKKKEEIAAIKELKDSLEMLNRLKNTKNTKVQNLNKEETILMANQKIGGDQSGIDVNTLKNAMNFFRQKLSEINSEKLEIQRELRDIQENINRIQKQLNNSNARKQEPTGEVYVNIMAKSAVKGQLTVDFIVMNAGWTPIYDLRATTINKPVTLTYKANIYQRTGNNWEGIPVTISTGKANISNTQPKLDPVYVSFKSIPPPRKQAAPKTFQKRKQAPQEQVMYDKIEFEETVKEAKYVKSEVSTSQIHTEFTPEIHQTIYGNGNTQTIHLTEYEIDADYTYYCVPKKDKDAFLLARITKWEKYNLVPAKTNLFFEGKYVGNSYLDPSRASDTLEVSLGRDQNIVVQREKLKDFESDQFIGRNQRNTHEVNITIKNNKQEEVKLIVQDQIPVSTNEDIEVKPIRLSRARHNKGSGLLVWDMKLKPGEKEDLKIKFSIEYPKKKEINF